MKGVVYIESSSVISFSDYQKYRKEGGVLTDVQKEKVMHHHRVSVLYPQSFIDVRNIADCVKRGEFVLCCLQQISITEADRMMYFLFGACYATNSTINKISQGIYLIGTAGCVHSILTPVDNGVV